VRRSLRAVERLVQRAEGLDVAVVAVDIAERVGERDERAVVVHAAAVLLDAVASTLAEVVDAPVRRRHPDHWHCELPALRHGVERREDLLVGEVAGGAEEDQRVGGRAQDDFSRWPPNCLRMADWSRFANVA
jgi:hypothetical protein